MREGGDHIGRPANEEPGGIAARAGRPSRRPQPRAINSTTPAEPLPERGSLRTTRTRRELEYSYVLALVFQPLFRFLPVNLVNIKKPSHRMFRHMHEVLNEVYLQNFLYGWAVKSRDESNEPT